MRASRSCVRSPMRCRPKMRGLLAYARALSIWRSRHRYCGACGAPLVAVRAGHALRCTNGACAQESFPRIDPAIIVLVCDGERALLGRQASWPPGRYSTLAGFVEPGESLEDAVAREVFEETGVPVHDVRYHSSQPWPFPSSLMVGFQASACRLAHPPQQRARARPLVHPRRLQLREGAVATIPCHLLPADFGVAALRNLKTGQPSDHLTGGSR